MTKLIAHRGNLNGPNLEFENSPLYVQDALDLRFDVEIDLWVSEESLFLGHDSPQYQIDVDWLHNRKEFLWIHCKNLEAIEFLLDTDFNYFWHQTDTVTITSNGYIWAYPGAPVVKKSIAVMPELHNDDIKNRRGICTDFVYRYQKLI